LDIVEPILIDVCGQVDKKARMYSSISAHTNIDLAIKGIAIGTEIHEYLKSI
jgi:hypothetical protein